MDRSTIIHRPSANRTGRRLGAMAIAILLVGAAACSDDGDDGAGGPSTGDDRGTVVGNGDRYEATITRTTGGIPHITADTIVAAAFGQGWASGQDRTCDLADQVIKVRGERARWFGPGEDDANIDSDVAWRATGLAERAQPPL